MQIKVANFRNGAIRWQILRCIHQRYIFNCCASSHRFRDISISNLWSWKRRSRLQNTIRWQTWKSVKVVFRIILLPFSISKILSFPIVDLKEVGQSHGLQLSQWNWQRNWQASGAISKLLQICLKTVYTHRSISVIFAVRRLDGCVKILRWVRIRSLRHLSDFRIEI